MTGEVYYGNNTLILSRKGGRRMPSVFDSIAFRPDEPIFQQLTGFVKAQIVSGKLRDGDEVPSRRLLAARLGINPMTVQKAYRQMEEEGYLETSPNQGSRIRLKGDRRNRIREELFRDHVSAYVNAAKSMGLDREAAEALVRELWNAGNTDGEDG